MGKKLEESCDRCGSVEFAISDHANQIRYCSKCNHVWEPKDMAELEIKALKEEVKELKAELAELKKPKSKAKGKKQDEIFE